jgi:hypothetical protein
MHFINSAVNEPESHNRNRQSLGPSLEMARAGRDPSPKKAIAVKNGALFGFRKSPGHNQPWHVFHLRLKFLVLFALSSRSSRDIFSIPCHRHSLGRPPIPIPNRHRYPPITGTQGCW